jgi:DNA-binding transcriptional regulator YdaS (Cro superfamily)
MELKKYLYIKGIAVSDFAEVVGISNATLSRNINGQQPYSERSITRIEYFTKGEVTGKDLIEEYEIKKEKRRKKLYDLSQSGLQSGSNQS